MANEVPGLGCDEREWMWHHVRVVLVTLFLVVLVGGLVASFVIVPDVFMVGFLGVLFGVFLCKTAQLGGLSDRIGYRASLALVVVLLLVLFVAVVTFFGTTLLEQAGKLTVQVERSITAVTRHVGANPQLESIVSSLPLVKDVLTPSVASDQASSSRTDEGSATSPEDASQSDASTSDSPATEEKQSSGDLGEQSRPDQSSGETSSGNDSQIDMQLVQNLIGTLRRLTTTTFGVLINAVLVLFIGLFLATAPGKYRAGVAHLFPMRYRPRVTYILNQLSSTIGHWILAQLFAMFVTGAGISLGLWLIRMEAPFALGLLAGLFTFVPNIGAAAAFVVAVLIALPLGTEMAMWVAGVFIAFQLLESYIVTPLMQKREVSTPPALLLFMQAVFGVMFGVLGAMVAAPLLAIAIELNDLVYQPEVVEASDSDSSG